MAGLGKGSGNLLGDAARGARLAERAAHLGEAVELRPAGPGIGEQALDLGGHALGAGLGLQQLGHHGAAGEDVHEREVGHADEQAAQSSR